MFLKAVTSGAYLSSSGRRLGVCMRSSSETKFMKLFMGDEQ